MAAFVYPLSMCYFLPFYLCLIKLSYPENLITIHEHVAAFILKFHKTLN